MACFLVPATEAIVTTIAAKVLAKKEKNMEIHHEGGSSDIIEKSHFSRKLGWLNNMLWGGAALLALEHVWHGEVVPWFPFLTNAASPDSAAEMLHEMATAGVSMAVLVTAVWLGMVGVSNIIQKRKAEKSDDNAEVNT